MRHGIDVSRGYAFILISILLNTGAALLLFNMIGDFFFAGRGVCTLVSFPSLSTHTHARIRTHSVAPSSRSPNPEPLGSFAGMWCMLGGHA